MTRNERVVELVAVGFLLSVICRSDERYLRAKVVVGLIKTNFFEEVCFVGSNQ